MNIHEYFSACFSIICIIKLFAKIMKFEELETLSQCFLKTVLSIRLKLGNDDQDPLPHMKQEVRSNLILTL